MAVPIETRRIATRYRRLEEHCVRDDGPHRQLGMLKGRIDELAAALIFGCEERRIGGKKPNMPDAAEGNRSRTHRAWLLGAP